MQRILQLVGIGERKVPAPTADPTRRAQGCLIAAVHS